MKRLRLAVGWVVAAVAVGVTVAGSPAGALTAPTFAKVFTPDTIGPGSVSALTFTITNVDAVDPLNDLAFTDTLPASVVIATPANPSSSCLGTLTAPDGGTTITFSGGMLATSSSCTISVDVTSSTVGLHTNTSGDLTSNAGNSGPAIADLTVTSALPGFTKSFSPATVPLGDRSTLTFTIDNTLGGAIGNLEFVDTLPTGMVVADPNNASTDCESALMDTVLTAVPGTSSIALDANGTLIIGGFAVLDPGATCTVVVDVVTTGAGTLGNSSDVLLADLVPAGKANATLTVTRGTLHLSKEFTDDPIIPGGTGTLEITVTNFDRFDPATLVAFTDTLPAGVTLASAANPVGCGGTVTGAAGGSSVVLTGGTVPAGASCTITVDVTAAMGGAYANTSGAVTGTIGGSPVTGNMASDTLFVLPAPILTKTFIPDTAEPGDAVTLRFTITDTTTSGGSTDIAFIDELTDGGPGTGFLPFPVPVTLPPVPDPPCGTGSSLTFVFPDTDRQGLSLTGGNLTTGGSCTFDVTVTMPDPFPNGVYTNTTEEITATVGGTTVTGGTATDDLTVIAGPQLTKSFTDDPVAPGGTVTLEFTLTHDGSAPTDATAITFTDDLATVATGLTATGLPLTEACDPDGPGGDPGTGTLSASALDTLLTFSGGELAPGESCTFSVTLATTAATPTGIHSNATSDVGATVAATGVTSAEATDDLIVTDLVITKEFTDDPVLPGGTVTLEFVLDNSAGAAPVTVNFFNDVLTDTLTGLAATGLPIMPPDCGGGTLSGTTTVAFIAAGSIAAGATCTLTVTLDVPPGAAPGSYPNSTSSFLTSIGTLPPVSDVLVVAPFPTVDATKEFTDDPVLPGGTVTLEFTITNSSADFGVTDIGFTDALPAGLSATGLPATVCGGGTLSGTTTLTLAGGSVGAGGFCTFSVSLSVPGATSAGTYPNTTSAVSGMVGTDPVSGAAASDDLVVVDQPIVLTKEFTDDPVLPGDPVTLRFTIDNVDPANTVSSIGFTDDLATVLTGLVATGLPLTPAGCGGGTLTGSAGDTSLTFAGGSLAGGASCSFDVTLAVPLGAADGSYPNTTSAVSGTPDGGPAASDTLDVELPPRQADLSITKTDSPDPVVAGQQLTYTLTVDNDGPSDADDVVITDILPAGTSLVSTSGCAEDPAGAPTCSLGIVANGGSAIVTIVVDVDADVTGVITNDASVASSTLDPDPGDNSTSEDTTVTAEADVSVTKDDGVTSAVPGSSVTYTIVAANAGPSDDPAVSLTDMFPAVLTCTWTSSAAGGASGNTAAGSGDLAETLSLPVDSSVTYTVDCTIDADATGTLSNTATVAASVTDPDTGNDSATDDDELTPEADISVTKDDGVAGAAPGDSTTYTIVVTNAGPSDDPAVSLTDTFPAVLTCTWTSVAADGASGNTAAGSGDLAETLVMPAGSSVTYTVDCTIDPAASGLVSNTASVAASVTDPNPRNDSATDVNELGAAADVSVTKDDGVTTAVPGETVTYTIVAANAGPSDDPAVSLTDTFPAVLTCTWTSVAADGASGNSAAGSGDLAETLSLPAGSSVTYTVDCTIDADATGTLSNTATVAASVIDTDSSNDSATDDDTVLAPEADVSVAKDDGVTSAAPGETSTYTIVAANAGPSDDPAVSLTDSFPAVLTCTWTSVAADGASGNTAAGTGDLAETLSLPVGSSVTYTVDCTIDADATGTLSNTATVAASVIDTDSSNDSATDDDTILTPTADLGVTKTDGVATAVPGRDTLTYTIVASNAGPSDDPSVSLTDTFPSALTCTFTSSAAGGAGGNTDSGAGDLVEQLSLPVGSSVTYTAACTIDPGATGTVSNTATVMSVPPPQPTQRSADPDTGNNTATDETDLVPEADISVTKDDGVTSARFGGDPVRYTIVVANAGPSDDPAVTLTDAFPAPLTCTWTSAALGGASGNTPTGSGDIADTVVMPAGSSVTYTTECLLGSAATGLLSNTATATASVTDPVPGNNSATDDDTVIVPVSGLPATGSGLLGTLLPALFALLAGLALVGLRRTGRSPVGARGVRG